MVRAVTYSFNTEQRLEELQTFYEANYFNLGTAQRATESAIENTEYNIEWMDMYEDTIDTWLVDVNNAIDNLESAAPVTMNINIVLSLAGLMVARFLA